MKVILLATHSTPSFENSKLSLKNANIEPHILGWREEWKGWKWRIELYKNFCENQDKDEVLVFLDAFDTLCMRKDTRDNFEKAFRSYNADIVFSSEWWCGSKTNCGATKRFSNPKLCLLEKHERKYVNAGFVCGKASALFQMYSDLLVQDFSDDQQAISFWIDSEKSSTISLALDTSVLCRTVNVFDVEGYYSFFVHFPGPMLKLGLFPHYRLYGEQVLREQTFKTFDAFKSIFCLAYVLLVFFILSI
jgi:hypothetical protein